MERIKVGFYETIGFEWFLEEKSNVFIPIKNIKSITQNKLECVWWGRVVYLQTDPRNNYD